jgi:hypothetical protein
MLFIARKIYLGRQLKRDIAYELEAIKQQYQQTQNKSRLATALSRLIRRATITFYPSQNIAGLTGEDWLALLDQTNANASSNISFNSSIGKILLTAPYQPEEALADLDAQAFIRLCESWLLSPHKKDLPAAKS